MLSLNLETEFQQRQETYFNGFSKSDPFYQMRKQSWEGFTSLGLPQKKHEAFQYIRLNQLYNVDYNIAKRMDILKDDIQNDILPDCTHSHLVFANGEFRDDLSDTSALPKEFIIANLSSSLRTYGAFIQNHWNRSLKGETNPFALLNGAIHTGGVFLYLPPNLMINNPIQILNIVGSHNIRIMPRIHLFASKHSSVKLVSTLHSDSMGSFWKNAYYDFVLESNTNVEFINSANPYSDNWQFDIIRASLKRDANFKNIVVTNGCSTYRSDAYIALTEENASAEVLGTWILKKKNQAHHYVHMDHRAPHCESRQLYKGILYDQSHSSFEGKVYVHPTALKTNAYQLNNNLVLSDQAKADSKPNLEIFADDVKASHGATVGKLDSEPLFYLRTRGLSEQQAKKLLIKAFVQEVLDKIGITSAKNMIMKLLINH